MDIPKGTYQIEVKGVNFIGNIIAIKPAGQFGDSYSWVLSEVGDNYYMEIAAMPEQFTKISNH